MVIPASNLSVLFDFIFNPWALFSVWAVGINTILLYLILSKGIQVSANRWFTLVLLSLIVWGVFETLDRSSATPIASDFWSLAGMFGWIFVPPVFLSFTLSYIGKEQILSRLSTQVTLFGPSLLLLFLGLTTDLINNRNIQQIQRTFYGWEAPSAPYFWVALGWIDLLLVASLVLLIRHWAKSNDKISRRQTALFISAVLIPVVGGSITNGLLPIFGVQVYQAAVLLTSIMSLIIAYAILKYKLFVINPATVATNIVNTMNEIMIVFNLNYIIEFANKAAKNVLGYDEERLVGQHIKKIISGDWESLRGGVLKPLSSGQTISGVDLELVSTSDKKIPVTFSASPLKDQNGNMYGVVSVAADISKIRDLFADITAERNKLTTTIESIVDGVLALDFEGRVITINSPALKMLDFGAKDIVGKDIDQVMKIFDKNGKRIFFKDLVSRRRLEKDTVVFRREDLKIITQHNKTIYVNLVSSAIKEGLEVGLGAIITMNDISGEKELEEMKIDFVSMAAHELRTPLTSIRGYLSVLQEELAKSLSSEQQSFLDKAFISSSQLAALVENLLSVSRIERGAMKIEASPQDWQVVLQETITSFLPLAQEKGIKLTLNCPEKLSPVSVDKFRIGEVLSNLVGNALNYTDKGGVVEITARTDKKEHVVLTSVRDTGQGIPESALPRLFTKFFRVSGVLEQGSKGTGLGLYISRAIVDMHGGKIWVESELGKGSTFFFTVPTTQTTKPLKSVPGAFKPKRIFIKKNNKLVASV
ncbi:MAG: ATP-binding protein [Candidatus Woykebacteria bacterium]